MYHAIKYFDTMREQMENLFPHHPPSWIDGCIDLYKSYKLIEIAKSKAENLSDLDIGLIKCVVRDSDDQISDIDPISLVLNMSSVARERSHGAAILSKVFMPESMYSSLSAPIGAAQITIGKVIVENLQVFDDKDVVVGLCLPKFENVLSKYIIISGSLRK